MHLLSSRRLLNLFGVPAGGGGARRVASMSTAFAASSRRCGYKSRLHLLQAINPAAGCYTVHGCRICYKWSPAPEMQQSIAGVPALLQWGACSATNSSRLCYKRPSSLLQSTGGAATIGRESATIDHRCRQLCYKSLTVLLQYAAGAAARRPPPQTLRAVRRRRSVLRTAADVASSPRRRRCNFQVGLRAAVSGRRRFCKGTELSLAARDGAPLVLEVVDVCRVDGSRWFVFVLPAFARAAVRERDEGWKKRGNLDC